MKISSKFKQRSLFLNTFNCLSLGREITMLIQAKDKGGLAGHQGIRSTAISRCMCLWISWKESPHGKAAAIPIQPILTALEPSNKQPFA